MNRLAVVLGPRDVWHDPEQSLPYLNKLGVDLTHALISMDPLVSAGALNTVDVRLLVPSFPPWKLHYVDHWIGLGTPYFVLMAASRDGDAVIDLTVYRYQRRMELSRLPGGELGELGAWVVKHRLECVRQLPTTPPPFPSCPDSLWNFPIPALIRAVRGWGRTTPIDKPRVQPTYVHIPQPPKVES